MKKIIYALAVLLAAGASTAEAQFLKKLKEKAEKTVKEVENAVGSGTPKATAKPSASGAAANGSSSSSDDDNTAAFLKNLHNGTMEHEKRHDLKREPTYTDMTPRLYVDGSSYYSDFHDGIAYMYNYPNVSYFFDKSGKKLFDTEMKESSYRKMPAFENGVAMIVTGRGKKDQKVYIIDKTGKTTATIPNAIDASNFCNGIACVALPADKSLGITVSYTIKYVDTKGNFVFPDLWYSANSIYTIKSTVFNDMMRNSSEGLTAFVKCENKKYLWGFRDANGKIVIAPKYIAVGDFSDGMAAVLVPDDDKAETGRWGFIDKTGKLVIPAKFTTRPSNFDSGYAMVTNKKYESYYIDKTGAFKVGPVSVHTNEGKDGTFTGITPFYNGYAVVEFLYENPDGFTEYVHGVIDSNFKILNYAKLDGRANSDTGFGFQGKHYFSQGQDLFWFDPKTFDRYSVPLDGIYIDGLSKWHNTRGLQGFIDENGDFVLIIAQNEF